MFKGGSGAVQGTAPALDLPVRRRSGELVEALFRRPVPAVVTLLLAYLALSAIVDPAGSLGTDTGGKVATLEVMTREATVDPDIGYWAEEHDPDGRLHPLFFTYRRGDRWLNVTTLPMIEAAAPLYALGGVRAALALPMLGAVLSALAARALARRVGSDQAAAWNTFWLVGLAMPPVVYALDLWEHTLGLAAMAGAVVMFLDALGARSLTAVASRALLGGGLVGLAASMRTEALVHGAVAAAVIGLVAGWRQRSPIRTAVVGAASGVGVAVLLGLNHALERLVIGQASRVDRATRTAEAGGAELGERLREGLTTTFGLTSHADRAMPILLGVVLVAAVVAAVVWASSDRGDRRSRAQLAAGLAGAMILLAVGLGPGFVPGLFTAAPVAAIGLLGLGRGAPATARVLVVVALAALPLVWWFQYLGGAGPQWGGRYVLVSGLLLVVVGMHRLAGSPRWTQMWAVALAVIVTGSGLWWMAVRTHAVADAADALAERPEPVLVSTEAHLFREVGAVAVDHRWLTARDRPDLERAFGIADALGEREVGLVQVGSAPPRLAIAGWEPVATDRIPLFDGRPIEVTRYLRR